MKKLVFPLLAALLFSCGETNSSNTVSSSGETSSSIEESSSVNKEEIDKENIAGFISYLEDVKGHSKQVNATMTNYYNFDGSDEATLVGIDSFTATRYSRNDASDIVIRKGSISIEGDSSSYEAQTFVSGRYVYQLVDTNGSKTKISELDTLDTAENALNISFAYTQIQNLQYLSSLIGNELVDYQIDLPTDYIINGTLGFSYSLTTYKSENEKSQQISHEVSITVTKGVISKATHITQNDLYTGNKLVNWNRVESSFSYLHGDYDEYTGNVFDISEFD